MNQSKRENANEQDTMSSNEHKLKLNLSLLIQVAILAIFGTISILALSRFPKEYQSMPTTSTSRSLEIIVPSDMWKNPTKDPSWNRVPLPDCCDYSRRRRRRLTIEGTKINMSCNPLKSPLRYVGPGSDLTPDDLKAALRQHKGDVILLGDSLMQQWFGNLACYLGASKWRGFEPKTEIINDFEREITEHLMESQPRWRRRGHLGTNMGKTNFASFDVPPVDNNGSAKQRVSFHNIARCSKEEVADLLFFYHRIYPQKFGGESPLLVLNEGVHFNIGGIKRRRPDDLQEILRLMFKVCHEGGMKCIFRESTPQHFHNANRDGLFPIFEKKWWRKGCMKNPPKSFDELNGWRNDLLHTVASEYEKSFGKNGVGFVKIMPIFNQLVHLSFAHKATLDCTHFGSNPEYWEPWHVSFTQVLRDAFLQAEALNVK